MTTFNSRSVQGGKAEPLQLAGVQCYVLILQAVSNIDRTRDITEMWRVDAKILWLSLNFKSLGRRTADPRKIRDQLSEPLALALEFI